MKATADLVIYSRRSGAWEDPATWEGGQVPNLARAAVVIRAGHQVGHLGGEARVTALDEPVPPLKEAP